jgi:O-succinylbenzoate synthase
VIDLPIALDESVRFGDPRAFEAADIVILKAAPLGGVAAALELARCWGGPVVVSGSLDSAVGLASGLALAAALTGDPPACGLGTGTLLARDVIAPPLVPFDGHMPVERIAPDLDALMAARDLIGDSRARWWRQRLADAWESGGAGLVEALDA